MLSQFQKGGFLVNKNFTMGFRADGSFDFIMAPGSIYEGEQEKMPESTKKHGRKLPNWLVNTGIVVLTALVFGGIPILGFLISI